MCQEVNTETPLGTFKEKEEKKKKRFPVVKYYI